jgi:hypothetical protein
MLDHDKHTPLPPGIDCGDIIAFGTTGLVARFPYTNKIVKIPHGGDLEASSILTRQKWYYVGQKLQLKAHGRLCQLSRA